MISLKRRRYMTRNIFTAPVAQDTLCLTEQDISELRNVEISISIIILKNV
jgi:hypothetical protein